MDYDIRSITITRDVELRELEAFRDILHLRARDDGLNADFWDEHLDEHEIGHISVDQRVYVVAGSETEPGADGGDLEGESESESDPAAGTGAGSSRFDSEIESRLQAVLSGPIDESGDDELEEIIREIVRLLESGAPREARLGLEIFEEYVRRLCDLKDDERAARLTDATLGQRGLAALIGVDQRQRAGRHVDRDLEALEQAHADHGARRD